MSPVLVGSSDPLALLLARLRLHAGMGSQGPERAAPLPDAEPVPPQQHSRAAPGLQHRSAGGGWGLTAGGWAPCGRRVIAQYIRAGLCGSLRCPSEWAPPDPEHQSRRVGVSGHPPGTCPALLPRAGCCWADGCLRSRHARQPRSRPRCRCTACFSVPSLWYPMRPMSETCGMGSAPVRR